MQFVFYLIPGSCSVESDTHITLIARLSNIGAAISPILLPGEEYPYVALDAFLLCVAKC